MDIKKPELSMLDRRRGNELFHYLRRAQRLVTKEELCAVLGWKFNRSNERRIRELISLLAKRVPIIATSNEKGYKLAMTPQDLEAVKHQWNELDSRIDELAERRKPLIRFYEKHSSRG